MKKLLMILLVVVVLVLAVIGLVSVAGFIIGKDKPADNPSEVEPVVTTETKNVSFRFLDFDGDALDDAYLQLLSVSFEPDSCIKKSEDGTGYVVTYVADANPAERLAIRVAFHGVDMLPNTFRNDFEIRSLDTMVHIPLSVRVADIKLYQDIEKIEDSIKSTEYDAFKKRVDGVSGRNYDYFVVLNNLLESKKSLVGNSEKSGANGNASGGGTTTSPVSRPAIPPVLDETILDMATLNGMTGPTYQTPEARARIVALKTVLNSIRNGKCPNSSEGLSSKQKEIVDALIKLKNDIDNLPETSGSAKTRKNSYQMQYSNYLRAGKDGKVSLNTAYTAVKALRKPVDEEMKKYD